MSIVLYIILVPVLLAVHYYVAGEFYKVAAMKGWPQKKYRVIALLLWLIGYLLIMALPDRTGDSMPAVISDDLPQL